MSEISTNSSEISSNSVATLYTTNLLIVSREFKGQSSGPQVEKSVVHFDTKPQFCDTLWAKIKPLIKAEIVLNNESFEWSTEELSAKDLKK